jgi:hypothetical protein
MLSIRRVSVASVVVAGIVWASSCFVTPQPDQTVKQGNGPDAVSVRSPLEPGTLLATRYHLRGRTTRFFQRSTRGATPVKTYSPSYQVPVEPAPTTPTPAEPKVAV